MHRAILESNIKNASCYLKKKTETSVRRKLTTDRSPNRGHRQYEQVSLSQIKFGFFLSDDNKVEMRIADFVAHPWLTQNGAAAMS